MGAQRAPPADLSAKTTVVQPQPKQARSTMSSGGRTYFHPVPPSSSSGGGPKPPSKDAAHLQSLLFLRGQSVTPPPALLHAHCANCGRPVYVNGPGKACRDGDAVFCSRNCLWSVVVDPGGIRLRAARRKAAGKTGPRKKRRKRQSVKVEQEDDSDEEQDSDEKNTFVHAMFSFHRAMSPGHEVRLDSRTFR